MIRRFDSMRDFMRDIDEDKLRRGREGTFESKLLAGAQMFELVCEMMRSGIRMQFPDADAQRVEEILRERLRIARKLEETPCPVTMP